MTVRILYVGGSGRSGSTLVDRAIGQLPGFVSTGEVRHIAREGLGENRLCGCGEPFDACPFWRRVGEHAFGGWDAIDRRSLARAVAFSHGDGVRSLLGRAPRRDPADDQLVRELYAGISEAADGATVIDSSKSPAYAVLLASIAGLEVRAIHLIRDSRGVAFSWSKTVTRPDTPGRDVEMLRLGPAQVSWRWIAHNAMMEMLGRRVGVARLQYEAFLADPRMELSHVLQALSIPVAPTDLDFIDGASVRLEADHTLMGNPMRMSTGVIPLRLDDAWRSAMRPLPRAGVTAMTWPMLLRYRYPLG